MTSTTQALEGLDVTYRQLDYWTRCGLLRADPRPRDRSGYCRTWPEHELLVAQVMARLRRVGLTLEAAAPIARRAVAGATAKRAERTYYETIGDGIYLTVVVELT